MSRLFPLSGDRLGRPQLWAGALLLAFLGECVWLLAHAPVASLSPGDLIRIEEGLKQWRGQKIAGIGIAFEVGTDSLDPAIEVNPREHSPLWYLAESVLLAAFRVRPTSIVGLWLVRAPYLLVGLLLGASLWYVARRLYGNAGGYVALLLYCFSPTVIRASTLWFAPPDLPGAWGTFGAVFTSIAVSHTLYAPREVVLWNWRRIALLGISLALAVGWHFALLLLVPLLLGFLWYLAPVRRWAASVIFLAALALGFLLLLSVYWFHLSVLAESLRGAWPLDLSRAALGMKGAYLQMFREVLEAGPVLALLGPGALAIYAFWPRARYFGNTAPLITALMFLCLRVASPHEPQSLFSLLGAVFVVVFVAGIAADVLETARQQAFLPLFSALLAANALSNLVRLARIGR
ncbi:MAG: hypothetical protein JO356_03260 [Acidobacteria bacterium]|nr:hypothetical protein [Acidobacteriota bacterium]